jgi:hypothetical protein
MIAFTWYVFLLVLAAYRIRLSPEPVLLTIRIVILLHVIYLATLALITWGDTRELMIGIVPTLIAIGATYGLGSLLVIPYNKAFIETTVRDACRMLRITIEESADGYTLSTKNGTTFLDSKAIAPRMLLGTIHMRHSGSTDPKMELLRRLLLKKFGHVLPHLVIKLN